MDGAVDKAGIPVAVDAGNGTDDFVLVRYLGENFIHGNNIDALQP